MRVLARWIILVFALTTAERALGDELTEPDRERARDLMKQGRREEGLGNFIGASEAYAAAYALTHVPTAGVRLAAALAGAGKLLRARMIAKEVVESPVRTGEPVVFAKARDEAKDLSEGIARRIPRITLRVRAGTTAKLDGNPIEQQGAPLEVDPGPHEVELKSSDSGGTETKRVNILEGRETALDYAAAPTATKAESNATKVTQASASSSSTRTVVLVSGFSLLGAGLVFGASTGVLAYSHANTAKQYCKDLICGEQARYDVERARFWGTLSNIGAITAGAGALITMLGFALPKKSAAIRPAAGFNFIGIEGRFK
jgi:hypothetical protein